jgi:hypothetical protein
MARMKNPRKWSKAQRAAFERRKNTSRPHEVENTKPLEAHYVGETAQQPAVDVRKLEETAFRRGMFTALQMVILFMEMKTND